MGNTSQSYQVTLPYQITPTNQHGWTQPRFNCSQVGLYSIYLPWRDLRLSCVQCCLMLCWFIY